MKVTTRVVALLVAHDNEVIPETAVQDTATKDIEGSMVNEK